MHKVPVDQLTPRMQVGKTVYGTHGEVLLARGTSLGDEYIGQLKRRGFHNVWILDGIADDVEPAGLVSERLRAANVRNLQIMYDLMAGVLTPLANRPAGEARLG